jgi:large subunit ribosomal protein L6
MSRIGKQPIELPSGVNVAISPGRVQVNGPLGELSQNVPARMQIDQDDGTLVVKRPTERGDDRALHGLTRSLVANMVEGLRRASRSGSSCRVSATARLCAARIWN